MVRSGGTVQSVQTQSNPSGTYTLKPGQKVEYNNGVVCVKDKENRVVDINNNFSQVVGGTAQQNQGSRIMIVGSPQQFSQNPHLYENKKNEGIKATNSATPNKKPSFNLDFISSIAKLPKQLIGTDGMLKSIDLSQTKKVPYQPTGNILNDSLLLVDFYISRLEEISITGIAKRALMIIAAETDRIAAQFENAVSLNLEWVNDIFGSDNKPKGVNPSTQNTPKESALTKKEYQKQVAQNHEDFKNNNRSSSSDESLVSYDKDQMAKLEAARDKADAMHAEFTAKHGN